MEGMIAMEPAGSGGFGYDPILMLPEYGVTSAELTMEQKNKISTGQGAGGDESGAETNSWGGILMKILIVSDTHRKDDNLKQVIEEEKPLDMLIHLGDSEGSEVLIGEWVNEGCRLEMVMGNNDFFSKLDRELELEIGSHRALFNPRPLLWREYGAGRPGG